MNRETKLVAMLLALAAIGQTMWVTQSLAATQFFPPITDAGYLKECGSCHMAYPPELLPARSWTRVLGSLQDHFGDSAQLDAPTQQRIHDYLVSNASDAPLRITATPYIAGIHAAVLDPAWRPNPRPKTLAECGVCHLQAPTGNYYMRHFTVTDEAFRGHGEP
jgi:cytochrome c553